MFEVEQGGRLFAARDLNLMEKSPECFSGLSRRPFTYVALQFLNCIFVRHVSETRTRPLYRVSADV